MPTDAVQGVMTSRSSCTPVHTITTRALLQTKSARPRTLRYLMSWFRRGPTSPPWRNDRRISVPWCSISGWTWQESNTTIVQAFIVFGAQSPRHMDATRFTDRTMKKHMLYATPSGHLQHKGYTREKYRVT